MKVVLLAALAVALLTGCSVAPLTPTTEVGRDHGVVVLRLASNAAPAGFFTQYDGLHVVSDAGSFQLSRTAPGVVRTGVFTGALLPGQYRISRFETGHSFMTVPKAFGSFTVKTGQLTDLGTLVFRPAGGSNVTFARTRNEGDTRELVAAAFPRVADAVLARPILDWDASPDTANLARIFAVMRATVAPVNGPVVAPSGAIYAGSILGQVLVRRPRGATWTQLDTGTTREILTVTEDGDAIVAGGEEGFLARSVDRGQSWRRMPAPDGGAIMHLVRRPTGLLAVSLLDRTLTVWEATGDAWQARNRFPFERSFNVGALPPHVASSATRLYVAMPNGTLHALDLGSGQRQRHEAPFSMITVATAGDLLYAYGATLTHSIWTSEDGGKTWRDLETSRRAGAPVFGDPRTGYVLYVKEIYGSKISVQVTKDAGRTWTETGTLPDALERRVLVMRPMLLDASGPTLFVFGTNGAVYATRDLGATWTEERRGAF